MSHLATYQYRAVTLALGKIDETEFKKKYFNSCQNLIIKKTFLRNNIHNWHKIDNSLTTAIIECMIRMTI